MRRFLLKCPFCLLFHREFQRWISVQCLLWICSRWPNDRIRFRRGWSRMFGSVQRRCCSARLWTESELLQSLGLPNGWPAWRCCWCTGWCRRRRRPTCPANHRRRAEGRNSMRRTRSNRRVRRGSAEPWAERLRNRDKDCPSFSVRFRDQLFGNNILNNTYRRNLFKKFEQNYFNYFSSLWMTFLSLFFPCFKLVVWLSLSILQLTINYSIYSFSFFLN